MKEKKDRVDDALAATRAAVEEGIVPGGGVAYIRAVEALETLKGDNEDQTTGIQIVKRAIEEPLRQIVTNAGGEGSVVVNKVKEGKGAFGYTPATTVMRTCSKRVSSTRPRFRVWRWRMRLRSLRCSLPRSVYWPRRSRTLPQCLRCRAAAWAV